MNPFKVSGQGQTESNYSQFILDQIKNVGAGEQLKIDIGGGSISGARMTVRYVSDKYLGGSKFKTKTSKPSGELWVMKIR